MNRRCHPGWGAALALAAGSVLLLTGCPSEGARKADPKDQKAKADDKANAKTGDAATSAEPVDLTVPDVKLVKIDLKLEDIDFEMDAPEGSKFKSDILGAKVVGPDGFGVEINRGRRVRKDRVWWVEKHGIYKPRRLLIDTPDTLVVESTEGGDDRFHFVADVAAGGLDFGARSTSESGAGAVVQKRTAALLGAKCIKTLKPKGAYPTEPTAILEKLDCALDVEDGKVVGARLSSKAGDSAIALLKGFKELKYLKLDQSDVTDEGLAHLKSLPKLTDLHIFRAYVSDEGLKHVGALSELTSLDIKPSIVQGLPEFTDAGMAHLGGLKKLESLDVRNCRIGDAGLTHLKGLVNLRELRVGDGFDDAPITDASLPVIGGLAKLETLNLNRTAVTDSGLKHPAGLRELKVLSLSKCPVGDAGMEHLAGLAKLETLHLSETGVGDKGLKPLKGLADLQILSLEKTKVTDAGLAHLTGLKKLRRLYVSGTAVTAEAKKKFDERPTD